MQMLSGEGGGQGQRQSGGGRGYQDQNQGSQGSTYEEPVFNPDDDIPF